MEAAPDKRQVAANEPAVATMAFELLGKPLVRGIGLCHHQQARRILVQPMHDTGPLDATNPERLSPQCAISAFTSVPDACPAAGCTTSPAGLSMTMRSASS